MPPFIEVKNMKRVLLFSFLSFSLSLFSGCGERTADDGCTIATQGSDCVDPGFPYCDPHTNECVEDCVVHNNCEAGWFCNDMNECEEGTAEGCMVATQATDCTDPNLPYCDESIGECVACTLNEHCGDGWFCNDVNECEQSAPEGCTVATQASDCTNPSLPYCDESAGECVECTSHDHCGDGWFCNDMKECEESAPEGCTVATEASDCTDTNLPYCNESIGECVECTQHEHCEEGWFCNLINECEESPEEGCTLASQSVDCDDPNFPYCDPDTNECVAECVLNENCSATQFCNDQGECETLPCGSHNCSGCCSADGVCMDGDEHSACGMGGAPCESCDADDICSEGSCGEPPVVAGRWRINGDGTVSDIQENRMWTQEDAGTDMSWADARTYCLNLSLAGYSDWRLPLIQEIRSLIDGCSGREEGGSCPVVDPDCLESDCRVISECGGCSNDGGPGEHGCYWHMGVWEGQCGRRHWSSSEVSDNTERAWFVYLRQARVDNFTKTNVTQYGVRCVR